MSVPQASEASTDPASGRDQQGYLAIAQHTPQWLLEAPPEARRVSHQQGLAALPWVERASTQMPGVLGRLHDDYREHLALATQVEAWLGALPDPQRFAEPLLKSLLLTELGVEVDVRQTWLFHPRRMRKDDSFLSASRDWAVESFKAFRLACRPLLGMALQNFEAWESEPDAMDLPLTKAQIFKARAGQPLWDGEKLPIAPHRFAALCRQLDLGRRYQELIGQHFDPEAAADAQQRAAIQQRRRVFERHEQTGLSLHLHLARMQEHIGQPLYQAVLDLLDKGQASLDGVAIECAGLSLWNVELSGIVVFALDRAVDSAPDSRVLYIPGDTDEPLKEFATFNDMCGHLRDRLLQADYASFLQQFLPLRHRAEVQGKLRQAFHPKVWNPGGWYEEVLDRQASLPFREEVLEGPLLAALLERKVARLKDDGLYVAVPTAEEDHKSLEEKLEYFAQDALLVLNGVGFAVPVVGAAMMVLTTAQLAHEVYEGIGEWTRGEGEQAWAYMFDVVENLAMVAALGGAVGLPPGTAVREMPEMLHPARLDDGRLRLWTQDLGPFAHDLILPAELTPDAQGLYHYQGKQWLPLDGRLYAVGHSAEGGFYLRHPRRADAYRPGLRYQHSGVWLHELDRPREWSGLELFRRLGTLARGLDEVEAQRMLVISGCHESQLRRALVDGQRPPALLLDCLARYQIHRELLAAEEPVAGEHFVRLFDMLYQGPVDPPGGALALLLRDFPGLPRRLGHELLEQATAEERALFVAQQRVPPRLAEEARHYLQAVRLARAYEGLYLAPLSNNDSTRLVLHSLADLPGWAEQYRIEIRGLRAEGPLLDSIGPAVAVHRRVLVKGADGYRMAEEPESEAVDLFAAVLGTLTSVQRSALGLLPSEDSQALRQLVLARPLQRPELRKVLHMQPIRPGARSPMRLANGRAGYPLSGRGRLAALPGENTLLDKIRLLELPDVFSRDLLQQLRGIALSADAIDLRLDMLLEEREQLQRMLPLGDISPRPAGEGPAPSDRQLIELALWQHWRDNLLPEIGRTGVPLRLFAMSLEDFPERLPDLFRLRVQGLELSAVSLPPVIRTADADGVLHLVDPLAQLLRRFPRVTALEIDALENHSVHDLPRVVVGAYPRLSELRLLNLHLPVGQEVLDELGRLSELRHLDLSGNRTSHLPIRLTDSLQLDYLGLDRLGLDYWPEWLDSDALDGIDALSLRDNHITGLPPHLQRNPATAGHCTWVSLRGNLLSQQALIGIRAGTWRGRRFRFDVEIPPGVEAIVQGMMRERDALSGAIESWLGSVGSSGERLLARRVLGDLLMESWAAQDGGSATRTLMLEDLHLEDFPAALPAFFFERVNRLELMRPQGSAQQLERLIGRFHELEHLGVGGFALDRLPPGLANLNRLRQLSVTDARLLVGQASIDLLARLPALTSLELSGNRLGEITDVAAFGARLFSHLSLERMEIARWPAWLDVLLPEHIQHLNLNHNRLAALPTYLLENADNLSGTCEISLEGNPLPEETVVSAHLSEGLTRPYSFRLDLPEHIRRLGGSHWSSSGGASSGGASEADLIRVDIWLDRAGPVSDSRRQLWQQLEATDDADDLLLLIGRLRHTAEYRNGLTRPDLVERVWQVLGASAEDQELRLVLNGMAEEPLRQLREFDTCPDGIRLEFNQMEVLVFTHQALRAVEAGRRGPTLYRLMRRLYRLQELDNIARLEARGRDEAEVRLAYRLHLANELDLPLAPQQMLYAGSANLHAGELDSATARVREGESGQGLLGYAAQRDFWLDYLREAYVERFTAIRERFEASVLGLVDQYPDDTPVQSSGRIQALIDQRHTDEANLVRELTHQEGLRLEQP
ncbi:NEL-type E3 ubiquitin ligase domain-containing protein [Pseudomonas sp. 148P]|uniref:RING-type E3 ubiquitin transferase n=1 Tax=Pseudomonas ulcerans TaxID=3115852 RepID=A0ABU7HS71_9PSED|nr:MULTISPECIES: NEL-type E3 ubiquitin ligase domain-containing protein [unclassified Pseudomonas]MEE1923402.1 NEL-type E3 ubiquitin ligase domain-containing protein [Pseudomonas sp. 147P]MEE1934374.1 NEL-type E3 ubiquitin ligase domain-containing protein [Pseudomonas sp. 148P]